jgi:hypothetical protein
VRKSRAKKRKSQPDDSDDEMEAARPTKKARPSALKKEKEKAEKEDVSMTDAEVAESPPEKTATSIPKSPSTADGKKKEPASPPKTPVNKRESKKPRKEKSESEDESEDGKRASTPPVLKVRLRIVISCPYMY